ncbi:hypothetical protein ACFLUO_02675 [Chloroflexota bacterium]
MVEIRYKNYYEVADISRRTISEARNHYKGYFHIPDKARADLNGERIACESETEIRLKDNDRLSFIDRKNQKIIFAIASMLLALAITGSMFAYGYISSSTTLNVIGSGSDFAEVTANTSGTPNWNTHGLFKGATGNGTLFDVNTATSNYTGDLVVTVSIANVQELVEVYRFLALSVEVRDPDNNLVDINDDGNIDSNDYALLTLSNSAVDLYITQNIANRYTIKLNRGSYSSHIWGTNWSGDYQSPLIYCEVAQRS